MPKEIREEDDQTVKSEEVDVNVNVNDLDDIAGGRGGGGGYNPPNIGQGGHGPR